MLGILGVVVSRKLPHRYAADFMAAGNDKDKQKAALKGCPEHWRDQVKTHINIQRMWLIHNAKVAAQQQQLF